MSERETDLSQVRPSGAILRRGMGVLGVAIREEPRVFAISVLGSSLFGAATVATAFVIGAITDRVVVPGIRSGHVATSSLVLAGLAVLGMSVLKIVGIYGRRLGAGIMQYRLQATYRRRITRRYLQAPMSWHHRHPAGQLLSNANSDVEAAWYPIAPFPYAVGVVVMIVVAAVALLVTDWVLALVAFAVFPAVFAVNVAYSRRMSPRMTRVQQLRGEVSQIAHESVDGALVVKTLGREAAEVARFRARAEELRDALVAAGRIRGLFDPVMDGLPNLGTLAVLLVGTLRYSAGAVGVGEIVSVSFLFTVLAVPVRAIGWVVGELPRSVVGWDRMQHVLGGAGAIAHGRSRLDGDGPAGLELRGVRAGYLVAPAEAGPGADLDEVERDVLHDIDLTVPPGGTVAVVGATGAGKSTVAGLLLRLLEPRAGVVRLDGVDVAELAPGELARHAALVPQSTFVFDDTVRGNVTLGAEFDDEQVWWALRAAQADTFVSALADGLDTRVGERGTTLSGGQRQRLALARALVRRPRLLVLDDATSAVDPAVEATILAGLREARHGTTVVVIAYRRATISLADQVVFLDRGRLVDQGPHRTLLERQPAYADLVQAYERAELDRQAARAAAAAGSEEDSEVVA